MSAYYNEIDPYAAQWLRNLIAAGHIAPGDVDERSIEDVTPDDLRNYTQCHFFAGIGVWSCALRRAGWQDDKPVWTGSCPCQPFSAAGKRGGFTDERHLWPAWFHLISQCAPGVIFGEQVASKDGLSWLDLVQTDLENTGYAAAAVDLCAAGVGAPHIRQRLFWVANTVLSNEKRLGSVCVSLESKQKTVRSSAADCWAFDDVIRCSDRRPRPIKSGVQPLANGNTQRVGRLRAYGNAIVPQTAAAFIEAFMEAE
ncbi:Modification methylase HhaI [Pectobacterium versatile]|uniref:DNA cytosine methyltransferase n=1 Tax=Pectobacterium versatile TaxID=2488639 RepID=UPI000CDEEAF7|nr:DNA cytosine methyltransferase [Pectobacterium versatile]POY57380.1 Modification methylase HhaI [Pectobacterium versatile]POY61536.1 Modification methylase HhaI [Pectobacterium versatile]